MTRPGSGRTDRRPDELEEDEKPRYANLQPGQSMETITGEDAI